jgi:uncharacterized membrane protein YGL010W
MYYIKLYIGIGFVFAIIFELILWLLNDNLDEKTKQYFSKYGGFIYVIKWPYILWFIVKSLLKIIIFLNK